jgi:hypothetical protein
LRRARFAIDLVHDSLRYKYHNPWIVLRDLASSLLPCYLARHPAPQTDNAKAGVCVPV